MMQEPRLGNGDKYLVDVIVPATPVKVSKESLGSIKAVFSKSKLLKKMKNEAVNCPVMVRAVAFPDCFACSNFNRRVNGRVGCKGLPLGSDPTKS
jgi:hypothetical protein